MPNEPGFIDEDEWVKLSRQLYIRSAHEAEPGGYVLHVEVSTKEEEGTYITDEETRPLILFLLSKL